MTVLLGNLTLGLAVLIAALAGLTAVASARFENNRLLNISRGLLHAFAALLSLTSAALLIGLCAGDFAIDYVARYTERALPVGYKIAAFWAGQEGSLLLWAWALAVMAVVFVITRRRDTGPAAATTVTTISLVCLFFAALILFAANPFKLVAGEIPEDGHGLNPLLQDPAMIAHPPLLFLGYAGFTFPFAMMFGALIAGARDNAWVGAARRWMLASWLLLSVGILLGAQWAYVELGWGGYWAWDPVENASLLPWLTGTALLHSVMAQQHRGTLKLWNASLTALTFLLCIFGTYLTRSGVIQSVHAFGESPIGTFFLTFLAIATAASVLVILVRSPLLVPEHALDNVLGREGVFLGTNILLVGMAGVTMIGTLFPIITRALHLQERTLQQSFYNKVVAPMGLLLVALMALGPILTYGSDSARRLVKQLVLPLIIAAAAVAGFWYAGIHSAWALACVAITTVVVVNILVDLVRSGLVRARNAGEFVLIAMLRMVDANHRRYGGQVVHVGMILIVAGITASSLFGQKQTFQLHPGQTVTFAGQTLKFDQLRESRKANYTAVEPVLTLTDEAGHVTAVRPQKRFYDKSEQANTEVDIQSNWKRDVYVTLEGWDQGGQTTAIQVIVNPLVSWIWTGGVVLTLGTLLCLAPKFIHEQVAAAKVVQPARVFRGRAAHA